MLDVTLNLPAELVERRKLLLGTDALSKVEAKASAVEVALEVEQKRFDRTPAGLHAFMDSRPDTDVRDAAHAESATRRIEPLDLDGVDTIRREELRNTGEVGRGKSEAPTACVAVDDGAR
jgi:hypothetical protein